MDATEPTLLLFPGLGADARIFQSQRSLPVQLRIAEWIEPESPRESLAHYASRMADRIGPVADGYIGGVSLGAMVALEAANLLAPRGVFVIGGCRSHEQISPLFRAVLKIGATVPTRLVRPILWSAPLALKIFEKMDKPQRELVARMLRENSPSQIRWSCRAILEWECCASSPASRIFTIHGELDKVIPLAGVTAQSVVRGGRHLINVAHAPDVNRFIEHCISLPTTLVE